MSSQQQQQQDVGARRRELSALISRLKKELAKAEQTRFDWSIKTPSVISANAGALNTKAEIAAQKEKIRLQTNNAERLVESLKARIRQAQEALSSISLPPGQEQDDPATSVDASPLRAQVGGPPRPFIDTVSPTTAAQMMREPEERVRFDAFTQLQKLAAEENADKRIKKYIFKPPRSAVIPYVAAPIKPVVYSHIKYVRNEQTGEEFIERQRLADLSSLSLVVGVQQNSMLAFDALPGVPDNINLFGNGLIDKPPFENYSFATFDTLDVTRLLHFLKLADDDSLKAASVIKGSYAAALKRVANGDPAPDPNLYWVAPDNSIIYIGHRIYPFNNTESRDLRLLITRDPNSRIVYKEIWPTFRDMTKARVVCAPHPREFVRAFYYRAMNDVSRGCTITGLFNQEFVSWVHAYFGSILPPWTLTSSAAHVSLRICYCLEHLPPSYDTPAHPHCLAVGVAPALRSGVYSTLVRFAAALIIGYGIRVSDAQTTYPNMCPGWHTFASRNAIVQSGRPLYDAFDPVTQDQFDEGFIPGCAAFMVAQGEHVYYASNCSIRQEEAPSLLLQGIETINVWTSHSTVSDVCLYSLRQAISVLQNRCIYLTDITIQTPLLAITPIIVTTACTGSLVHMHDCQNLIVGVYSFHKKNPAKRISTNACPIMYNIAADSDDIQTGARLRACSVVILDLSNRMEGARPFGFFDSRQSISTQLELRDAIQCVHIATVSGPIPKPDTHRTLVTLLSGMHHFRDVFFPCDNSIYTDVNYLTQQVERELDVFMKTASENSKALDETKRKLRRENLLKATSDGEVRCKNCIQTLRDLFSAQITKEDTDELYPFCSGQCFALRTNAKYVPQPDCAKSATGPCAGCARNYKSTPPRVLIQLDPFKTSSKIALFRLVALLRRMRCYAHIVIEVVADDMEPSPNSGTLRYVNMQGDSDAAYDRYDSAEKIIAFLLDPHFFPRIFITLVQPGDTVSSVVMNVTNEFSRIFGHDSSGPCAPQWHETLSPLSDSIHAMCFSLVARMRDHDPLLRIELSEFTEAIIQLLGVRYKRQLTLAESYHTSIEIRGILIHFDHIGLIKYTTTSYIIWVCPATYYRECTPHVDGNRELIIRNGEEYTRAQSDRERQYGQLIIKANHIVSTIIAEDAQTYNFDPRDILSSLMNNAMFNTFMRIPPPAERNPIENQELMQLRAQEADERAQVRREQDQIRLKPEAVRFLNERIMINRDAREPHIIENERIWNDFQAAQAQFEQQFAVQRQAHHSSSDDDSVFSDTENTTRRAVAAEFFDVESRDDNNSVMRPMVDDKLDTSLFQSSTRLTPSSASDLAAIGRQYLASRGTRNMSEHERLTEMTERTEAQKRVHEPSPRRRGTRRRSEQPEFDADAAADALLEFGKEYRVQPSPAQRSETDELAKLFSEMSPSPRNLSNTPRMRYGQPSSSSSSRLQFDNTRRRIADSEDWDDDLPMSVGASDTSFSSINLDPTMLSPEDLRAENIRSTLDLDYSPTSSSSSSSIGRRGGQRRKLTPLERIDPRYILKGANSTQASFVSQSLPISSSVPYEDSAPVLGEGEVDAFNAFTDEEFEQISRGFTDDEKERGDGDS